MNKQILTRSILLTLAMSTAIPAGQAWAEQTHEIDGDKLTVHTDSTVGTGATFDGTPLSDFKTVEIFFDSDTDEVRALGVWSAKYDLPNTDIIVHVKGDGENNDAIHLTNWNPHFVVNNYTAYVDSPISDAINLSHDATKSYATIKGDLTAVVENGNGIRANSSINNPTDTSTITVTGKTDITINSDPITVYKQEHKEFGDSSLFRIEVDANASTTYNPAAVYAGDDMYSLQIGDYGMGGQSVGKGIIDLQGDTTLRLNGEGNYGVYAGKNGSIDVNNISITSGGKNSYGIAAKNSNLIYGNGIELTDITVTTYLFGRPVTTPLSNMSLDNADDSANTYGSTVTLNGDTNVITMTGDNSYALYAEGVDASGHSNTIQSGEDGIGSFAITGDIAAENGGLINLHVTGNAQNYLEGDVKAYGTKSNNNATVTLSVANALAGQGTLAAANDGIVNLELGANSNWTGRADDYGDANSEGSAHEKFVNSEFENITSGGAVNLTMGNDAVWNVDGQSWITNLTASGDNMFINLLGTEADRNANADALTIYNLEGHATFAMHLDGVRSGSDMLYIKNTDGSSYDVYLDELVTAEDMYQNGTFKDGLRFATVGKGDVTFNVYSLNQGIYNLKYQVKQTEYDTTEEDINAAYNEGTDSAKPGSDMVEDFFTSEGEPPSIQNEGLAAQDTTEVNTTGNFWNYNLVDVQDRQISDAGKTIIAMSKVNYSNAVYMDRLNKRMGEARFLEGDDGLWVRLRHDRIGKSDAFRSKNTMFEIGYDWKDDAQKDGTHYRGFAFDYMRGTADYTNVLGEGDVRRAGLWYHDTWMGDKGHYTDYVVKYGRLSNDFDIYGELGEKIKGDYDNDVWSVSAEYGRKKDIGNDWYFEPQVQAQYAYVTSADYTTSQNTKVSLDSIDSLIGRAGFRLGRDTDEANTVYFKADILHEFLGGQSIRAMDSTGTLSTTYENEGTWYDVGFGFSHRMSKDKYMFLDVEKLFGNDNEDTYQVNIGLNMAF